MFIPERRLLRNISPAQPVYVLERSRRFVLTESCLTPVEPTQTLGVANRLTTEGASCRPAILAIGTATPALRVTQEESFSLAGYAQPSLRRIFRNSGIDFRHFYFEGVPRLDETSDELNDRYRRGAIHIGCRAARACLDEAGLSCRDVDLLVVCSSTGYVCPDIGSQLIAHIGFRSDVQRVPIVGLGCAGAIPSLRCASDFVQSHPGSVALVVTVEICSACYYADDTLETVVGNAICADGAAAFLLTSNPLPRHPYPAIVDFQTFLDPDHLQTVGFDRRDGKLRIVLGTDVRDLAAPLIRGALAPLLARHGLSPAAIRFWVAHPGGRRVMDNVQEALRLTDADLRFSRSTLRRFGNMSSPTVMFVLDDVIRTGDPRTGDWGVMIALGPGMAAEVALLQW
jgi:predicted naringenin-chalcone synthase